MRYKQDRFSFRRLLLLVITMGGGLPPRANGGEQVPPALSVKAANILRVSFPNAADVEEMSFEFSTDGVTYHAGEAGLPRGWQLFRSVIQEGSTTTVLIPAIASWGMGDAAFLFKQRGTYHLRWRATFADGTNTPRELAQTIEVAQAKPADIEFIASLADETQMRRLFGDDFFGGLGESTRERMLSPDGSDFRALKVIAELLKLTRSREATEAVSLRKSTEQALVWAETLQALANELPESSYAPYATYYAGCCYSTSILEARRKFKKERNINDRNPTTSEADSLFAVARSHPHFELALQAFESASERGDAYLKPRALYQKAFLEAVAGRMDDAERSLGLALDAAPGEETVGKWVSKLRDEVKAFRERSSPQGSSAKPNKPPGS